MIQLLEFVFQSLWHWLGFLILGTILFFGVINLMFRSWNRFLRMLNIRKHGWPPAHCDADGDFKPEPEE